MVATSFITQSNAPTTKKFDEIFGQQEQAILEQIPCQVFKST